MFIFQLEDIVLSFFSRHFEEHLCKFFVSWVLRFRITEGNEIVGCESCLTSWGDEDKNGIVFWMIHYCFECWFVHSGHSRTVVFFCEAFDVTVNGDWSNTWLEVKESISLNTEPISNISCICKCSGQTNDPDLWFRLFSNHSHSRYDDFKHRTSVLTKQMDFIYHNKCDLSDITSMLPVSRNTVPFFRCCYDNVSFLECL